MTRIEPKNISIGKAVTLPITELKINQWIKGTLGWRMIRVIQDIL